MNKAERESLIDFAANLSDEELEAEYYDSVFNSLGSQIDYMVEHEYDIRDIKELEKYEKYLCEKSVILSLICEERGIKLWQD